GDRHDQELGFGTGASSRALPSKTKMETRQKKSLALTLIGHGAVLMIVFLSAAFIHRPTQEVIEMDLGLGGPKNPGPKGGAPAPPPTPRSEEPQESPAKPPPKEKSPPPEK